MHGSSRRRSEGRSQSRTQDLKLSVCGPRRLAMPASPFGASAATDSVTAHGGRAHASAHPTRTRFPTRFQDSYIDPYNKSRLVTFRCTLLAPNQSASSAGNCRTSSSQRLLVTIMRIRRHQTERVHVRGRRTQGLHGSAALEELFVQKNALRRGLVENDGVMHAHSD